MDVQKVNNYKERSISRFRVQYTKTVSYIPLAIIHILNFGKCIDGFKGQ
jgi:hypothetical protein